MSTRMPYQGASEGGASHHGRGAPSEKHSTILRTAARAVVPLMVVFSFVILLRGHNNPGGGFIGGLIASSGMVLHGLAFGPGRTRRLLRVNMVTVMAAGLLLAIASGVVGLLMGTPFLTGYWTGVPVPGLGELKVGTPVTFDIGVYLVVVGVVTHVVLTLLEEK